MVPASYSKPNNGAQVSISTIFTLCVCSFEVVYLWVSWNAFRSLSLRCWLDTHMIPTWIGLPVSIFCCHCRGSACEQKSHVSLLVWACTGSPCHDDNEATVCGKCRFERFMKAYIFSTVGKSTWDLSIAFMDKHFQRNFILRSMIPISTSQISGNVALAKKCFVVVVWEQRPESMTMKTMTATHTWFHLLCRCWCYNYNIGRWYSWMFIPHDRCYARWNHEIDSCIEYWCGQKGPHHKCRKEDGPWLVRIVRYIPCMVKWMVSTKKPNSSGSRWCGTNSPMWQNEQILAHHACNVSSGILIHDSMSIAIGRESMWMTKPQFYLRRNIVRIQKINATRFIVRYRFFHKF